MKGIVFTGPAEADITRLDRHTAQRVLVAITRLAETGSGDVKFLAGKSGERRLRVGDWRVRFVESRDVLTVKRVLHHSEAYR